MINGPLVSIVIPTYNRDAIIARTIDNVFEQTYRAFEVIVVDDGSTDATGIVLRRYDSRIRVVTQGNAGPSVARNRGARVAKGEIIAFQDSDDLWRPDKLARQVALLELDRSIPCCLSNVVMRMVDGKPFTSFDHSLIHLRHEEGVWFNVLEVLATRFILFNQAAAIRRWAFEKVGGFPEDLKYLEDYDLPLRLSLEGPWAFIREPLVIYGEGSPASFSDCAKKDPAVLKECEIAIYERMLARLQGEEGRDLARRGLRRRLTMARRRVVLDNGRPHRTLDALVGSFGRLRLAALRRSPWFPQPRTIPLADLCARGRATTAI